MFGGHRLNAFLAIVLAISCALPEAKGLTLNYNNICLLINSNKLIASAESCSNYYSCLNGVATQQTCPTGTYFSKDMQSCQPASTVNCYSSLTQPCSGASVGTWAPMSNSCQGFYYCSANGPIAGSCPDGENFNPTAQACQYTDQYQCDIISEPGTGDSVDSNSNSNEDTIGINLCSIMPNGVFFGNAASCSAWNLCTNNVMTSGTCETNSQESYFNPQKQECDYAEDTPCTQVTHDPNLIDSPTNGGPCTSTSPLQMAAIQCNAYYQCNNENYILNFCPSGQYYDTTSSTCVPRMSAINNVCSDRCIGSTKSFVNSFGSNCTGYLYCKNGVEQSSGTCPNGQFFNEVAGGCISGNPGFNFCVQSGNNQSPVQPPPNGNLNVDDYSSSTTTTSQPTTK